ncbi:hypothetical protein BDW75DRAFT_246418 [Aspergillus navahoensis]
MTPVSGNPVMLWSKVAEKKTSRPIDKHGQNQQSASDGPTAASKPGLWFTSSPGLHPAVFNKPLPGEKFPFGNPLSVEKLPKTKRGVTVSA